MVVALPDNSAARVAHSYPGSEYLLPCDKEEGERLWLQHRLLTRLFSSRLIFPPVMLSANEEILDIGTGAGAWLCDCQAKLDPSIQFYGIDIEPRLFPSYAAISSSVHLSIRSATDLPFHWSSKFALINQRLLVAAYTKEQWYAAVQEIHRVLRPGGYVQLVECCLDYVSGPTTEAHVQFMQTLFDAKGLLYHCHDDIEQMLTTSGFVDVHVESVIVKLGKWAGQDGIDATIQVKGALGGMKDVAMRAGGLGYFATGEEFDKRMEDLAEEWDKTEGSRYTMKIFYARKP